MALLNVFAFKIVQFPITYMAIPSQEYVLLLSIVQPITMQMHLLLTALLFVVIRLILGRIQLINV